MVHGSDAWLTYGELRGLLQAFAWFNEKVNHSCTFTFDEMPKPGTVDNAVEEYFRRLFQAPAGEVVLTPLPDWSEVVRKLLDDWLFRFQDLIDPAAVCALTHRESRQSFLNKVITRLTNTIRPIAVWSVQTKPTEFYECAWDDIAFETNDRVFLLHLGASD
jgi:hypothetical protein